MSVPEASFDVLSWVMLQGHLKILWKFEKSIYFKYFKKQHSITFFGNMPLVKIINNE